jgi:sugar-specific transcriptional regulator TrmB
MADALELLQALGFGEYEARAYQALLQHNPATGYEIAKVSGIPRPNIYPVLQRLEERRLVLRLENEESTRFVPAPVEEYLDRVGREFGETLAQARQVLPALAQVAERSDVLNTSGYTSLLTHARSLVDGASGDLLVALWPEEARLLADRLTDAEQRGVEITTLCMAACAQECGGCRGRIQRSRVVDTQGARWLMLVPDEAEVLAGEVPPLGEAAVVRTRQRILVSMVAWFIRHSIALAALLQDASLPLDAHIEERTRAALAAAGPAGSDGWLAYMRRLLGSARGSLTEHFPGTP